ncbi:DNA modification methylase [Methylobacterium sp. WL64]|nr:DNA modification methylase [Methylobacterium sp. WL64]
MSPATPTEPHLIPSVEPPPTRIRRRTPVQQSSAQRSHAIVNMPPGELVVARAQLRKYQPRHREHLLQSMKRWGIVQPILIDADRRVIAGHQILAAALELGLATVPTIALADLSDAQARALRIALNKLPELSSWDPSALKDELAFLADFDIDLVSFTAFSSAELDVILNAPEDNPDDALPEPLKQAISQLGDIWTFDGGHRLGCLDVLSEVSLPALMAGVLANLVLCDPPYNVPVAGHVTGRVGAREFAMASGEMSVPEFTAFLHAVFELLWKHAEDGSLSLQFMDWRHMQEMLAAGHAIYQQLLNLAVWAKTNPGMGSLWRSGHELCFIWKKGTAPHINNVELGRYGRNRSNVWSYPGANGFARAGDPDGLEHVTPKNVAMIQDAILDVSRRGDIVLDAFSGSGTTLVAAHRAKRRGYGLDIDPFYVDLAVRRMERCTRVPARHAETGLTFAEMAEQRGIVLPPRSRRT